MPLGWCRVFNHSPSTRQLILSGEQMLSFLKNSADGCDVLNYCYIFTWLFLFCFETYAAVSSFMHGMLFIWTISLG